MEDERVYLTPAEAEAMLSNDEFIHTFRSTTGVLIGADRSREKLIKAFEEFKPELSGEMATDMGHGLVLIDDIGPLFIETQNAHDQSC
jgi:hypothetical protein